MIWRLLGDAPTTLSATAKVMYSRFINQSQSELVGDIGLGIYDQEGKLVKVTPYGQEGRKIFTKERFVFNEGKWVSGGVIDDKITFTLDFSTLTNGYLFTLSYCCTDAGRWYVRCLGAYEESPTYRNEGGKC